MIRKLIYRQPAVNMLLKLKRQNRTQHIQVIRARALSLQAHAEEQMSVKQTQTDPNIYETFISAVELNDMIPPEGYRLLFLLTSKHIVLLTIYEDHR